MLKLFRFLVLSLFVVLSACSKEDAAQDGLQKISIVAPDGSVRSIYKVEIADTKEKMYNGLMGRTSLNKDAGMLFDIALVPQDVDIALWMKDTLIPLDMIFVDENGKIFHIHENAQPNDTTPIYPPQRPQMVLEVNGGQSAELGIQIGDTVNTDSLKKAE